MPPIVVHLVIDTPAKAACGEVKPLCYSTNVREVNCPKCRALVTAHRLG
jgi:hypothetical protein